MALFMAPMTMKSGRRLCFIVIEERSRPATALRKKRVYNPSGLSDENRRVESGNSIPRTKPIFLNSEAYLCNRHPSRHAR